MKREKKRKLKMMEKLVKEYIKNGGDLIPAMEKAGYSTERRNVWQIRHSDRFREAVREEFTRLEYQALMKVVKTGKGSGVVTAVKQARAMILGPDETPSAGGGETQEGEDEQEPGTAW